MLAPEVNGEVRQTHIQDLSAGGILETLEALFSNAFIPFIGIY